jgi:hypothetical protein
MNHPVLDGFLSTQGVVVLDGALATELERRGADLNDPLWSARLLIENPGLIEQVHTGYLWAGADVITTASYQASFAGFERRGLSQSQSVELMRLSVRLACAARDRFWSDPAQQIGRLRPPRPLRPASPHRSVPAGPRGSTRGGWATTACETAERVSIKGNRAMEMPAAWTRPERAPTPPWKPRAEREIPTFPQAHNRQPP